MVDQHLDLQVRSQSLLLFPQLMLNVGGFFVGHVWPQDLPDPHTVSSSIQQMWALTEVMQTQQTTASVGRFDVSLLLPVCSC